MPPPRDLPAVVRKKPTTGGGGGTGGTAAGREATSHSDSETQAGEEGDMRNSGKGSGSTPNFGTIV